MEMESALHPRGRSCSLHVITGYVNERRKLILGYANSRREIRQKLDDWAKPVEGASRPIASSLNLRSFEGEFRNRTYRALIIRLVGKFDPEHELSLPEIVDPNPIDDMGMIGKFLSRDQTRYEALRKVAMFNRRVLRGIVEDPPTWAIAVEVGDIHPEVQEIEFFRFFTNSGKAKPMAGGWATAKVFRPIRLAIPTPAEIDRFVGPRRVK